MLYHVFAVISFNKKHQHILERVNGEALSVLVTSLNWFLDKRTYTSGRTKWGHVSNSDPWSLVIRGSKPGIDRQRNSFDMGIINLKCLFVGKIHLIVNHFYACTRTMLYHSVIKVNGVWSASVCRISTVKTYLSKYSLFDISNQDK